MIYGVGTDIIEISRIGDAIDKYGERFLARIFTETERAYCETFAEGKNLHYAARFAAKESFSKAVGTGITQGFKFKDIGVENLPSGQPKIVLHGGLKEKYGHLTAHISLSHTEGNAVAYVILETKD
jgi:holo-[acyl-carrier protein] synthase